MKSFLIRMSVLSGIVVLGLITMAHAQPGSDSSAAPLPTAGSTVRLVGQTSSDATSDDIPSARDVFGATPIGNDQPADQTGRYAGNRASGVRLVQAQDAPPPRYAPGSIRNAGALNAPRNQSAASPRLNPPAAFAAPAGIAAQPLQNEKRSPTLAPAAAPEPIAQDPQAPAAFPSYVAAQPVSPTTSGGMPEVDATSGGQAGMGRPGHRQLEGAQTPSLTIEKIAPAEVQVGKPAIFKLQVRNCGGATANDVQVSDEIPQGAQLLNTTPRATRNVDGKLVWNLGSIKAGDETTVSVELVPNVEGELGSVATVHFTAAASVRTLATKPALAIDVVAPSEAMIGEDVAFKIRISNPGTGIATGVILSDRIPAGLEHPAGAELEYEIGDLKPNDFREVELTMKAIKPGPTVNLLVAQGEGQVQAESRTQVTVVAPGLEIALEGPRRRFLERQATYTVSLSNPGTATAQQIELVTYLPTGLQFIQANNSGQYDPQTRSVHWVLEELPAKEKGSVTLTAMPIEAGQQTLRIESTAQRGLSAEKQEAVVIEGAASLVFQVVDTADPVEAGGDTTYEIHVANQGSKDATNVQISAILPPEMKPMAAEGPTRYSVSGQQVRFIEIPRLAPKADATFRLRVQCLAAGDLRVRVQMTSDESRTPITKEEGTQVYTDR
jgi:uncharacterized repeat protein (TIGR01451 family)